MDEAVFQQCFERLCIQAYLDPLGKIIVRPAPLGYLYRRLPTLAINVASAELTSRTEQQGQTAELQPTLEIETQAEAQVQTDRPPAIIQPEVQVSTLAPRSGKVEARVWEGLPMVSANQGQEIGVSVLQGGLPVANVEPDLTITLPGNNLRTYYMYPTSKDGHTRVWIDPIAAESGTLIPYKVCIYDLRGEPICLEDSFLIWDSP